MKSLFASSPIVRLTVISTALAFSTLLTACGQKGPLFMPIIPPPASRPVIVVPPPVPATPTTSTVTTPSDAAKSDVMDTTDRATKSSTPNISTTTP